MHAFDKAPADFDLVIPAGSWLYWFIRSLSTQHSASLRDLSGRSRAYHVSRLAVDLKNPIDHLKLDKDVRAIGTSLGCAVLRYCFYI